jgi:hypothetical protein
MTAIVVKDNKDPFRYALCLKTTELLICGQKILKGHAGYGRFVTASTSAHCHSGNCCVLWRQVSKSMSVMAVTLASCSSRSVWTPPVLVHMCSVTETRTCLSSVRCRKSVCSTKYLKACSRSMRPMHLGHFRFVSSPKTRWHQREWE